MRVMVHSVEFDTLLYMLFFLKKKLLFEIIFIEIKIKTIIRKNFSAKYKVSAETLRHG